MLVMVLFVTMMRLMVRLFAVMLFLLHTNVLLNTSKLKLSSFSWNNPVTILILSRSENMTDLSLSR